MGVVTCLCKQQIQIGDRSDDIEFSIQLVALLSFYSLLQALYKKISMFRNFIPPDSQVMLFVKAQKVCSLIYPLLKKLLMQIEQSQVGRSMSPELIARLKNLEQFDFLA